MASRYFGSFYIVYNYIEMCFCLHSVILRCVCVFVFLLLIKLFHGKGGLRKVGRVDASGGCSYDAR